MLFMMKEYNKLEIIITFQKGNHRKYYFYCSK